MNALCRRALRCYRILCAVSTDECSVLLGWNVTEMRADCLYLAGKRCKWCVFAVEMGHSPPPPTTTTTTKIKILVNFGAEIARKVPKELHTRLNGVNTKKSLPYVLTEWIPADFACTIAKTIVYVTKYTFFCQIYKVNQHAFQRHCSRFWQYGIARSLADTVHEVSQ